MLTTEQIGWLVDAYTRGYVADEQMAAMAMAIFLNGMERREIRDLTLAMIASGETMNFAGLSKRTTDKHSTGGVGDKITLPLAPLVASFGVAVPQLSGRGLGHTGGTLDKLESMPGYDVNLSFNKLKKVIKKCGFGLIGQTKQVAPADKKLYALRDATATVPYIPLIVASIMSKKLAEGLDALVLDVKTGSGAFIKKYSDSVELAKALCRTGTAFGVNTKALITDMSEPLGKYVGNAHEVYECVRILRGEADDAMRPTLELSVELTAQMLVQCDLDANVAKAKTRINSVLASGEALSRFRVNIELQGGDPRICDRPEKLLTKRLTAVPIVAGSDGYVAEIDTFGVGRAICDIGGGRVKAEDGVDHAVGYECSVKLGNRVRRGDTLGIIFARTKKHADSISEKLLNAYKISEQIPKTTKLIRSTV